ncbi:MAG: hypothetical protein OEV70_11060 [Nitrospirota bacterium]|nr:hypothetical protein [Nitrospirota bacterium]
MGRSWEHLLGGYATDTLTDEEKRRLFEAALHDQTLFNALADEEALKAMLADPEARQRILASLEATEHPGRVNESRGGWLGWFRQPSSLAWAGSLAALGLVLIFGWQMEKEWGSVVSREREAERSSSKDEVAFRQQKPSDESTPLVRKEAMQRTPAQTEGIEAGRQLTPDPATRVDANNVDRRKHISAMAEKESEAREKGQAIRRQRANEQVAQAPSSPSASDQPKVGRAVQPLAVPATPEVAMPDMVPHTTAPGRFADQAAEEAPRSSPSAQELFYASSGSLADEVIGEKKDTDSLDQGSAQPFRGALSKARKPPSKKKAFSFPLEGDVEKGGGVPTARGLRYSFVQHTKADKDEEVDSRQITGNWSEIRLAVESNVSGYLYVLASLGNGKWQKLSTRDTAERVKTEVWINVKPFQRVEFPLGQLTNAIGKPVVSSLTVLLSPELLNDLGQWLGSDVAKDGLLIEHTDGVVFVVQIEPGKEVPLRLDISLKD